MRPNGEVKKARLWCVENNAWSFDLQFNPEAGSMSLVREVTWGVAGGGNGWGGSLEYEDGTADKLSFKVMFDETTVGEPDPADASGFEKAMLKAAFSILSSKKNTNDVLEPIQKLYRLTLPLSLPNVGKDVFDTRPPVCAFVWDRFEFMGVVSSVTTEFMLVDESGAIRRVMCDIGMEGRAFSGSLSLESFLSGEYKAPKGSGSGSRSGPSRDDILKMLR